MPGTIYTAGIDAFNEKKYEKAAELFLQELNENPENVRSYFYLGQCYFLSDKKQQAIPPLKRFIDLRKTFVDDLANLSYVFDLLGQCYEAENKDTAALKCYETATKINSQCASAWNNMGLLYLKSAQHHLKNNIPASIKMFKGALFFINQALKLCGEHPAFLHSIASCYEKYIEVLEQTINDQKMAQQEITNYFSEAIKYYRKALAACKEIDTVLINIISSNLTECLAQFGDHLYRNGQQEEAQKKYLEVIQLDPEHLSAINQLGMSLFKQNSFSEARAYFSSILQKTKKTQEIADAWLNIACTYRMEKAWSKAKEALDNAATFAPNDPDIVVEEMKLTEARGRANFVSSPVILLANSNSSQQVGNEGTPESSMQYQ
ncbi:photosystem I assembly protein Ycf3 [Legionella hackeliae]|uniref:PIK-related kinase FAT domain-containing protein n=2 Tax=Legionella hackeliae TaxID=449 RepID=A0A0A8UXQ7_LEGHA|nr:tetratricopeptide repeat protein [Legionella hackeliae]KTD13160.1 photosystem I assembly protein Ycf3 [Legionella hackeliae]CEK11529.1 conserved protein of unknown function [TPR Domain] [Legionella hackeliae]STX48297.1 photosystem I assembly protein Ycf3 [Legionella hackeliae]